MTPAVRALERAGVPFRVLEYPHDPASGSYGEEAAAALGVSPDAVFKTLVASADGSLVVAVVPVSSTLDLKALAVAIGAKRADMAEPGVAERVTGYVVGGISPLGQKKALRTVVDESALGRDVVHVSGGKRGLEIALHPTDLIALTGAGTAPIARR